MNQQPAFDKADAYAELAERLRLLLADEINEIAIMATIETFARAAGALISRRTKLKNGV